MKLSPVLLALCFALAPIAHVIAAHHDPLHQVERAHRHAIPQTATAFVPAPKVDDDSDGLTRNRDECNRGCIDSN
jgi:hypothetical protein